MEPVKPLRQEDYLAMAEELRQKDLLIQKKDAQIQKLDGEIARWRRTIPPEPKPPKPRRTLTTAQRANRDMLIFVIVVSLLAGLGIFMGEFRDRQRILDFRELEAEPNCFRVSQPDRADPWDPFFVWKVRAGRNHEWRERLERPFPKKEDAEAFVRKWDLKECTP